MSIEKIRDKVKKKEYRFSDHAVKRMIERNINRLELEAAIINGEVIEEYPEDKYCPTCLIYGKTEKGRHLHVQVSLPPAVVIITTYEPESDEWLNFRIRR